MSGLDKAALLLPEEMGQADRLTIEGGTSGLTLMRRAGAAIAGCCRTQFPDAKRIAVLAGPGNNGGDALVAAALLANTGVSVELFHLGRFREGDLATVAGEWTGETADLSKFKPTAFDLVIDGLFGAGLSKIVDGQAAEAIRQTKASGNRVLAIDLPSGIAGASGACLGTAFEADATVTFFRRKPGHLLQPGRRHCGKTIVADIGISTEVLGAIRPAIFANGPDLWKDALLWPGEIGHKYDRGHAVVFSGSATRTGAARMSATAAQRGGAGLVTMFSPASALLINASHLTGIMLKRCDDGEDLAALLEDARFSAFVLGPGFGAGEKARVFVAQVLRAKRRLVLDADGITSFGEEPDALFDIGKTRHGSFVLTPHAGEFKRLFPDLTERDGMSKVDRSREAAKRSGAVVVFKGSDTVIAAPDGRTAINGNGTPWLATAGTGDVLTGLIAGQLAQGVPTFEAACAGVWMHGRAAELFGPGLIADDLANKMPTVLAELLG